jgi:hypothetical protein
MSLQHPRCRSSHPGDNLLQSERSSVYIMLVAIFYPGPIITIILEYMLVFCVIIVLLGS